MAAGERSACRCLGRTSRSTGDTARQALCRRRGVTRRSRIAPARRSRRRHIPRKTTPRRPRIVRTLRTESRPHDWAVRDRSVHRSRRHGDGVSCAARRPDIRAPCRHQDDSARDGFGAGRPQVPSRTSDSRLAGTSEHRVAVRWRHDVRRPALLCDGARIGDAHRSLCRRASARHDRSCSAVSAHSRRRSTRTRSPRGASRHQADQRDGIGQRASEAARLRHRHDSQRHRRGSVHGHLSRASDDARLRKPRTDSWRSHFSRNRCVRIGTAGVRARHRSSSVPARDAYSRRDRTGGMRPGSRASKYGHCADRNVDARRWHGDNRHASVRQCDPRRNHRPASSAVERPA